MVCNCSDLQVGSQRMQGVLLLVFTKFCHLPFLRGVQTQSTRTGLGGCWVSQHAARWAGGTAASVQSLPSAACGYTTLTLLIFNIGEVRKVTVIQFRGFFDDQMKSQRLREKARQSVCVLYIFRAKISQPCENQSNAVLTYRNKTVYKSNIFLVHTAKVRVRFRINYLLQIQYIYAYIQYIWDNILLQIDPIYIVSHRFYTDQQSYGDFF